MSWFLKAFSQYADFSGRARRREYWYFQLFSFLITVALAIVDILFGTFSDEAGLGLFSGIASIAMFLPAWAVQVRRLHDIGRSGWWILIGLIPIIGPIILLVFHCTDSDPGKNEYGPNPKSLDYEYEEKKPFAYA